MRLVVTVLSACLWMLLIARGFDRTTVEGAMTISGWAILGSVPAAWLVRRGFWRAATAVGVICVLILPSAWWSLQIALPEPQPFSGTVRSEFVPGVTPDAGFPRTGGLVGPTGWLSKGARWLVPVPDTRIPDGLFLDVARLSWYGAWSLGSLMYLSAPFLAPAVAVWWLVGATKWPRWLVSRVRAAR